MCARYGTRIHDIQCNAHRIMCAIAHRDSILVWVSVSVVSVSVVSVSVVSVTVVSVSVVSVSVFMRPTQWHLKKKYIYIQYIYVKNQLINTSSISERV